MNIVAYLISRLFGLDVTLNIYSKIKTTFVGMWGYAWVAIPLAAGVGIYFWWAYRTDARRLTRRQMAVLWTLRGLAAVTVLLILLKPVLHVTVREVKHPVVGVFIDESTSMELPGARDNPLVERGAGATRAERSRFMAAKRAILKLKEDLQYTHRLKVYKFSDTLSHVTDLSYKPRRSSSAERLSKEENEKFMELLKEPTGDHSDIGDCMIQAIEEFKVGQPSGMIILSDGRRTGGATLMELADEAAKNRMMFHTIALGTKEPIRDLAITDLFAPAEAPVNDVLAMRVTVTNHIQPNLTIEISIFEQDELKEKKRVTLPEGRTDLVVGTIPEVEGERKFKITVPEYPDELTYDNNFVQCHVNIVKKTLRVLFIAGIPTIEYHYIVPSLIRDPIIEVSCWLQDADVTYFQQGNKVIDRLPRETKEWEKFDVVILYDIDPNNFENRQESGLEHLVRKGGGALFIAGRTHGMDKLLQVRTDKMKALLPVEIDKNRHPNYGQYFGKPFRLVRTSEARQHPVFTLEMDDSANDGVWESLPEFYWHHPVVTHKPSAIPLMKKVLEGGGRDGRGDVIMAMQRYGEGVTFYTGIQTLWRWRYPHENYDYDRFWSQIVRYLGETRLMGSQKQVVLKTDKKLYSPGETVKIVLAVLDPALLKQLQNEELFALITDQTGAELKVPLVLDPTGRSQYSANYAARRVGSYSVRASHTLAEGTSDEKKLFDEKKHFDVQLQSLEYVETTADLDKMAELAENTEGKHYNHRNMDKISELADLIPVKKQFIPHESDEDIWDSLFFVLLFICLVSTEWYLRKLWNLL